MKIPPSGAQPPKTGKASGTDGSDRTNAPGAKPDSASGAPAPITATQHHEFSSRIQTMRAQVAAGGAIDHAKVQRVTQMLDEGTFTVNAGVVADRMLQGATEVLAKGN
jgi:negative regulator of flagellin synthesis FlgM